MSSGTGEPSKIRKERDFYIRLLDLADHDDLDELLREALSLIVEISEARQGYLEVVDEEGSGEARWSIAHGLSAADLQNVRQTLSRGIIAEAMTSGRTITTPSALLDSRFADRDSVRLRQIEAVLCTPIRPGSAAGSPLSRRGRRHLLVLG